MVYQVLVKTKDGKIEKHFCNYDDKETAIIEEESKGNTVYQLWLKDS